MPAQELLEALRTLPRLEFSWTPYEDYILAEIKLTGTEAAVNDAIDVLLYTGLSTPHLRRAVSSVSPDRRDRDQDRERRGRPVGLVLREASLSLLLLLLGRGLCFFLTFG